jgi:diaminopimelate epimerase
VASVLNGLTDRKVCVSLAGGEIDVEWDEASGSVFMTGPAETVFEGEI